MLKFLVVLFTFSVTSAWAEVKCSAFRGDESLHVRIIDTFLEKIAYVKHQHPRIKIPVEEVAVRLNRMNWVMSFVNEEKDFSLHIDSSTFERRHPPVYRGFLTFGHIFTPINCLID